nr:Obg family GTPase CgtA [Candidatus Gracilibacteria bacterium]
EGASEGKGLGHKFLRHVSRTKLLVHIIDCTSENPQNDYKTIISELKLFDKKLSKLKQIVAINKIDMLDEETLNSKIEEIKKLTKSTKIYPISCMTRKGLKELMFQVFGDLTILQKKEKKVRIAAKKKEVIIPILHPHIDRVKFFIKDVEKTAENTIFHVGGKRIEQLIVMTDISNPEGLERVYHYMGRMGLQKAVEKKGATFGDIIVIKGKKIPYRR